MNTFSTSSFPKKRLIDTIKLIQNKHLQKKEEKNVERGGGPTSAKGVHDRGNYGRVATMDLRWQHDTLSNIGKSTTNNKKKRQKCKVLMGLGGGFWGSFEHEHAHTCIWQICMRIPGGPLAKIVKQHAIKYRVQYIHCR